jgi:hypothetical protein
MPFATFAKEYATILEPDSDGERPVRETVRPVGTHSRHDEPTDEEKQVLAGGTDASGVDTVYRCAPSQTEQPAAPYPAVTIDATASSRASVPESAWPVTASGRQWRWNARSTLDRAGSSAPSGITR